MNDTEKIPLSYLSQYYFCKRRAGLILLEQAWEDNVYTVEGSLQHERVHTKRIEKRGNFVKLYELSVFSELHCLSGKCDCVEAYECEEGAVIPALQQTYQLYPIEYKHGRIRNEIEYQVQLCAQAMCLEEMFGCCIPKGALFYIDAHRRIEVELHQELRKLVTDGASALRKMLEAQKVPSATFERKCLKCSLYEICQPKVKASASSYLKALAAECCEKEA